MLTNPGSVGPGTIINLELSTNGGNSAIMSAKVLKQSFSATALWTPWGSDKKFPIIINKTGGASEYPCKSILNFSKTCNRRRTWLILLVWVST